MWNAAIAYSTILQELRNQDQKFEFKFIVKKNDNGHTRVEKWESGDNHKFDGTHIQKILDQT